MITVISESLFLAGGFDFLVSKVEFNLSETAADAVVTLVPPQVYTGEDLPDPWYEETGDMMIFTMDDQGVVS